MSSLPKMHIGVDKRGTAFIAGTRVKVKQLVSFHRGWGWTPEKIHENLPQLTLAQIYAAFAYYHDHQAALEAEFNGDAREAERLSEQHAPGSRFLKRLRDR